MKSDFYTLDTLKELLERPHLLGHLMGKDRLNELHSEWIRYCWDTNEARALMAFRGGYKSTAIDVVGIVRWFLLHPNDRIAILRKSFNDAATIVSAVKQAMELPEIKELFKLAFGFYPKAKIAQTGKLRYNFKTTITPEVSLTAFGIDSSLTGFHFDKIVCDDIITLRDRVSPAERERTKEMVRELATNIIDPGKGSIWVGTPWHEDDAWKVINNIADIALYPLSQYSFLSPEDVERKRRSTSPFLFAANYELEIRKDSSLMFSDSLYSHAWNYSIKNVVAHIDAAFDGQDYCALTFLSPLDSTDFSDAKKFQVVGYTYAGHVKDWMSEIKRLYKLYSAKEIHVETNADKGYLAAELAKMNMRVKTYHEKQNKDIKIQTYLFEFWDKLYWSPDTNEDYLSMILDWRPNGNGHDDCPDSIASLIREVISKQGKSFSMYSW